MLLVENLMVIYIPLSRLDEATFLVKDTTSSDHISYEHKTTVNEMYELGFEVSISSLLLEPFVIFPFFFFKVDGVTLDYFYLLRLFGGLSRPGGPEVEQQTFLRMTDSLFLLCVFSQTPLVFCATLSLALADAHTWAKSVLAHFGKLPESSSQPSPEVPSPKL